MKLKMINLICLAWIVSAGVQAQIFEGDRLNSEGMHASFTVKTTLNMKAAENAWQRYARSERMGRTRTIRGSDEMRLNNPGNTGIRARELLIISKANQIGNATEITVWFKADSIWIRMGTDEKNYEAARKLISAFSEHLRQEETGRDIAIEKRVLRDMERERSRFNNREIARAERDIKNFERELERKHKELEKHRIELAKKDKQITDQKSKIKNLEKQKRQGN